MKYIKFLPLLVSSIFFNISWADSSYPLQEYELIVIENLPESLSLDMSLSQIEKAKESSRVGAMKKKLNVSLFQKIAPLIASQDFSSSFNLLQIPTLLPLKEILADLNMDDSVNGVNPTPADFIVLIAPKLPLDFETKGYNQYSSLYPQTKAPNYDIASKASNIGSYEDLINRRMMRGAEYLFQRQNEAGAISTGFFTGALIAIHSEGTRSWAKAKLAVGLPTGTALPFEQETVQIKLKQLYFPRIPYDGYITKMDYPVAMISVEHYVSSPTPLVLNINFGTIGAVENNEWNINNTPEGDGLISKWFAWKNPYNVPHFRGEILSLIQKEMLGRFDFSQDWINGLLSSWFDIQLNLHSVTIDLQTLTITNVRLTVDLPLINGSELIPTLYSPDPEIEFKNEGNKVLDENKDKVKTLLDSGLMIFNDKGAQKMFIDTLNNMIAPKATGATK
jgi:hypothetical protein